MVTCAVKVGSAVGTISALLLGFASSGALAQELPDTLSKEFLDGCRSKFAEVDAMTNKAGAGYAGYHRIAGFPYLRSDRMLASFGDQLHSFEAFDAWTWELRENDGFARNVELSNMGMPAVDRAGLVADLRLCAVWLSNAELMNRKTWHRVYIAAQLPDRVIPADPRILPILDQDIRARQAVLKAQFASTDAAGTTPFTLWQARKTIRAGAIRADHKDPLGRIGYTNTDWQKLAEKYAPNWLIETGGRFDLIGAPSWSSAGQAAIDTEKHFVYYVPSYARVQGKTLVQLTYFVWFSERISQSAIPDREDGKIDGLMWRVTIAPDGSPIVYDAMHMSGFDQIWFIPESVAIRKPQASGDDPVLVAQTAPSTPELTVKIHSGSHIPWRVSGADASAGGSDTMQYELHSYEELMTLPLDGGKTRSFFNAQGIVPGSERPTPLKTAGIPDAGAIRQWGNQPTSVTGRHFFDDPGLIDHLFILPVLHSEPSGGENAAAPATTPMPVGYRIGHGRVVERHQ